MTGSIEWASGSRFLGALRWSYLVPLASFHGLRYRFVLRRRPLASLSGDLEVRAVPRRRPHPNTVVRAVRLGTGQGPIAERCLVRSLVTARFLARFGYPATVVIGVPREGTKNARWRAHAWVEIAPNDAPAQEFEEIARLTA